MFPVAHEADRDWKAQICGAGSDAVPIRVTCAQGKPGEGSARHATASSGGYVFEMPLKGEGDGMGVELQAVTQRYAAAQERSCR